MCFLHRPLEEVIRIHEEKQVIGFFGFEFEPHKVQKLNYSRCVSMVNHFSVWCQMENVVTFINCQKCYINI